MGTSIPNLQNKEWLTGKIYMTLEQEAELMDNLLPKLQNKLGEHLKEKIKREPLSSEKKK